MASKLISLSSSKLFPSGIGTCLGCVTRNHSGPLHHSSCPSSSEGNRPQEAQSARFWAPFTWFHWMGAMSSVMHETQFQMYHRGFPSNQLRTRVLSVQALTSWIGIWSASLMWNSSWASNWAPQSSNWGIVKHLMGATLVLEVTRATWTFSSKSIIRKYTTPSSEASQEPWSWNEVIWVILGK